METILVVEDMVPIRQAITAALAREGYNVLQAGDGKEGLKLALHEHPDLLLVDIILPSMDGVEMVRQVREDEWGKTATIMMLTNVEDSDKILAVQKHHVYDYLVKSNWELDEVIKHITTKLKSITSQEGIDTQ